MVCVSTPSTSGNRLAPPKTYPFRACFYHFFSRVLLVEDKPKDVKSVLRGETDTQWNLTLPQIDNIL